MDANEVTQDSFSVVPLDETSVIRKHSRSFSMAARWLPADVRGDVEKLYAWCRWCDEAVDSAIDLHDATARLAILREDVQRIFEGQAVRHPASRWLADLVQSKGIRQSEALDLLAGMEMDLHLGQVEDEETLLRYCYCAAGVVGLMMCRVMGVQSTSAEKHAIDLGMAMQLTNIARDVAEDWKRGRCYVPKTWVEVELPHLCTDPSNDAALAMEPPSNSTVRSSVERLLSMAEVYYSSGLGGIAYLPRGCHRAIILAAELYREIGREILRQDVRVMDGRIKVPRLRIVSLACNALIRSVSENLVIPKLGMGLFFSSYEVSKTMVSNQQKMNDAKYLAYLGISLTSFMASALFVMVSLHPKDPSYAALPIVYAAVCVGIGVATNVLARKAAARLA
jgi:phytoene synthase